jgi:4-hydroxybenzoate polyprenyltransferase
MNFDTAIGAAITSLFVTQILGAEVPHVVIISLFLTVLAIYNFDHLLDAKKIPGIAISGRHRFYQQNFLSLALYQVILLMALLTISWFVPTNVVRAGIILAVVTLIYFLLLFIILPQRFAFKEFMIAVVFASGLFIGPIVTSPIESVSFTTILLWVEIFLLAIANTFIFSWFDYESDRAEGHSSLAQILGPKKIRFLSYLVLTILVIIIVVSLANNALWADQVIILAMGLVLFLSLSTGKIVRAKESLRIMGEAIFLIPLIRLIF